MLLSFLQRSFFPKKRDQGLFESLIIDLAAIMVWRGIWGLLDLFIFPENQVLSFTFSAVLGVLLLISIRKYYS